MRLDQYVAEKHPELSRSYISRLISDKQVLVNEQPSKPGYRLRSNDEVALNFDLDQLQQIEDIDLPVLYEDDQVLVIDKPVGVISHARGRFWNESSVASFVRQKTGQVGERAGIVHRLDRVTSGVMICAKTSEALAFLQKQFSARKVKKTYVAIVAGHLDEAEAVIDMPIGRNPNKPQLFQATEAGKPAQTKYTVEKSFGSYDIVRLEPTTGRTHQIRIHLQAIGHPIVGDHLYGGEAAERLFLHAQSLEVILPSGEPHTFTSPLPDNFKSFEAKHV